MFMFYRGHNESRQNTPNFSNKTMIHSLPWMFPNQSLANSYDQELSWHDFPFSQGPLLRKAAFFLLDLDGYIWSHCDKQEEINKSETAII